MLGVRCEFLRIEIVEFSGVYPLLDFFCTDWRLNWLRDAVIRFGWRGTRFSTSKTPLQRCLELKLARVKTAKNLPATSFDLLNY